MILINNWGNDFLFALLDQKEQIEQFTNLASKHLQEWIEGGHDVKENIPTLIHMLLPEKASHSTKRARSPNPNKERDNEGRQSNDGTPEDNNKENRKQKPRGETNNLQAKKVKKTSQNKTATKSSNEILKPLNPKTAEYQASVSAVKKIYDSFATASFPPSVPEQPPPTSMQPTSSVQPLVNVQLCSPNSVTNPMILPELSSSEMWNIENHPPLVCHPVFQRKRPLLACNWHYPVCRSQQMSHFLLQRPQPVQRLFPLSSSRMGDIKQRPLLLSHPVSSRKHRLKACTQHYPVCKPRQMSNLVLQLQLPLQ